MNILVLNCGSTSLKFKYINMPKEIVIAEGCIECIGKNNAIFKYTNLEDTTIFYPQIDNYSMALTKMFDLLLDKEIGVLKSVSEVDLIAHRVVHGGTIYNEAVIIDDNVLDNIKDLSKFSPLHNNCSYKLISKCREFLPSKINIASFDTSFHMTIPKENYLYPIPIKYHDEHQIRKYGFHGNSYKYVLNRLAELTNTEISNVNSIFCHLGGGASMCSIQNGQSFDTTMGLTPLDGLMMSTRSGSIDPSIIPYLMEKENLTIENVMDILNRQSGYLGICGEDDIRTVCDNSEKGYENSVLARSLACQSFKKNLGSMMAVSNKIDSVVITGGMGTRNNRQREMILKDLSTLGIDLDYEKNINANSKEMVISTDKSRIPVWVIPTDEELQIARNAIKVLKR